MLGAYTEVYLIPEGLGFGSNGVGVIQRDLNLTNMSGLSLCGAIICQCCL